MASPSGSVFSETLQEITNTKLEELSKRRSDFETAKTKIVASLEHEKQPTQRLVLLSQGVKDCYAMKVTKSGEIIPGQSKNTNLELELKNLDKFLAQSKYDPSVSPRLMRTWEESLLHHLNTQSLKFQYASLYAQLVTEWLSTEKSKSNEEGDVAMTEGFEDIAKELKQDSRREWERVVFEPAKIDEDGLGAYLNHLFGLRNPQKAEAAKALQQLREKVTNFEIAMTAPKQFNPTTLSWVAEGLLSSDLLTDEKREVLRDFKNNPVILAEIADVLNMRISALENWSWGSSVSLEQRRKISGVYNILMHEDLLQAIFLHYIGVKWSVFLKDVLRQFRKFNGAWKSSSKQIPKADIKRRGYYLGSESRSRSVQSTRDKIYRTHYFMANLMDSDTQQQESLEGEEAAEYQTAPIPSSANLGDYHMQLQLLEAQNKKRLRMANMPQQQPRAAMVPMAQMSRKSVHTQARSTYNKHSGEDTDDEEDSASAIKRPMEDKQRLIRLLSTEIAINTRLYGEVTAFHSMFESWNSLLPHETILAVLSFFGISHTWINFFTKFLKAPLKFLEDDPLAPPRTRRRGTPASHALSETFGELILFCLDFAVNQSTDGNTLFRMYDDFWFWSRDHSAAVTAWKSVTDFVNATGTYISPSKTGTVRISSDPSVSLEIDRSLPAGDIRWGFLKLSRETGRFEIDETMVDKHVVDLRKQLQDKRKSIISFIQAWNTYAGTFFTSNFGKPANCFGRGHVDQMLATHQRIQHQIFSPSSSASLVGEGKTLTNITNVADYLKNLMLERFGVSDIPDAYLFFPMELGGLDLKSPFISIMQVRSTVLDDPTNVLDKFFEAEREIYNARKAAFDKGLVERQGVGDPRWEPESERDRENFMSFEEFTRYREDLNYDFENDLVHVYKKLLELPKEEGILDGSARVMNGIEALGQQGNLKGIHGNWSFMEPYWRWVAQLYGPEAMDRFGGLNIVEPGLLPMGMVSIFRDKRVKWQG